MNSPLIETKLAGTSRGSLGSVSSISGIVDCGSQTSGRTTITLTGQTATGNLNHSTIDPVKVTCAALPTGASANVIGLTHAGSSTVEVVIDVQSRSVTLTISAKGSKGQSFSSSTGTGTATSHGAHIDADVSDAKTSQTLHVSGDATCGK